MLQRRALAFLTCHEQHRSHRSRHARTHRSHVGGDELHGAGRVDVYRDVLARVYRVEVEQLRRERVGCIVVDFGAEEDDAVHHQAREHVHLCHVELALLKYIRVEVLRLSLHHVVEHHAVNAESTCCEFSKIVHICKFRFF